ncbi:MAG: c-type cytochrome domain-containing protein, partial [Verrucomicrobiota bacterium]
MATLFFLLARVVGGADLSPDALEFFETKIRPVLAQDCYECHQTRGKKKGGLILDHRAALLKGGDSGPALVAGDPDKSLLMIAIRHEDPDLEMPKAGAK